MQVFRNPVVAQVASSAPALGSRPYQLTARAPGQQRKYHVCADMIADRQLSVGPSSSSPILPDLITHPALDSIPVILPATTTAQGATATSPSTSSTTSPFTAVTHSSGYEASTSGSNGSSGSSRIGSGAWSGQDLSVTDPDAVNPNYNRSGLNGLTTGATSGLHTGSFTVTSQLPVQYTITEVQGIFDLNNKALLRGVAPGSFPCALGPELDVTVGLRRFVVIDENINRLYGQKIRQYFAHHGVEAHLLPLPTCEQNKELELVTAIADALEDFKINRRQEPIIAIGGGVCLDVTGLAANLYRRNTCIIKVPTTLMAVVDAAVGIKTAVNFHEKKNKLGTYQPPLGVLYDTAFLHSLEGRHISNGSAEVLKMACIKDHNLFELLETYGQDMIAQKFQGPIGSTIIRRSIQGMLEELEYNLWEAILVRLVDYGHTVSPELEMAALRSPEMLLHGEAVSIDMALSCELAYGRGLLSPQQRLRVLGVMRDLRLPLWHDSCNLDLLMKGLDDMTRTRDGLQRVPLMKGIGAAVFVYDITRAEMGAAVDRLLEYAASHGDAVALEALAAKEMAAPSNNVVPFPLHPVPAASSAAAVAIETAAAAYEG